METVETLIPDNKGNLCIKGTNIARQLFLREDDRVS